MSQGPSHFNGLYAQHGDPWDVRDRFYERRKMALVMAMLPRPHYRAAFEPGCGIGLLSVQLAQRCDRLLAADFSQKAVSTTRQRTAGLPQVEVRELTLPRGWPHAERFDLVVISEWAYYLDDEDLNALCHACAASCAAGAGDVVACHWRRPFDDRLQETESLHARMARTLAVPTVAHYEDEDVLIDVWSCDGRAVSTRDA